jgi:RNA polymerase sigma-70 factor (ECF subfamily)
LIEEAESHLRLAATFQSPGRYQWEAMIQSVHAARRFTGRVAWDVILRIYDILVQGSAGLGARIGQAVAMTEVGHASRGLEMLEALPEDRIRTHTPYWVARANALEKLGQNHEASKCWTRAIGLTTHPRFRAHLQVRRNAITPPAEM